MLTKRQLRRRIVLMLKKLQSLKLPGRKFGVLINVANRLSFADLVDYIERRATSGDIKELLAIVFDVQPEDADWAIPAMLLEHTAKLEAAFGIKFAGLGPEQGFPPDLYWPV